MQVQNQSVVESESVEPKKEKPELVDLTDETAQKFNTQSLIQETHEEALLRAANNSTNHAVSQSSQPHNNGEPQPSTSSGFTSNQGHGTEYSGDTVSQDEQKNADAVIKPEDYTFDHDNEVETELKTEPSENVHGSGGATNTAEVKQESSDRNLETSQVSTYIVFSNFLDLSK